MKNVLVPTDLTHSTSNTMKYALSLCSKSNLKMFFYHASTSAQEDEIHVHKKIADTFKTLNYFLDESRFDIIIEKEPFSNKEVKRIIDQNDIDLVIMGTSPGDYGLTFFDSYVSELINEVSCPVLSVPHDHNDLRVDRIGYASELFDLKDRIKEIIPLVRLFDAHIEIFHVYPVFPEEVNLETFNAGNILLKLSAEYQYDKINIHFVKTQHDNEPVSGIREFLRTYKPDILVMYHKPRGLFDKLVMDTGTTEAMVRSSSIPILALNQKTACRIM